MPGLSPSEIALWAAKEHPETAVLVFTAHECKHYLAQMFQAGAAGFLDKNERSAVLITSIRNAAQGQIVYTQEQQRRAQQWIITTQAPWESLTSREQEVLCLLGKGLSNREIGDQLSISEKTVSKHVSAVFSTIGVTSRTEAALWWTQSGLDER